MKKACPTCPFRKDIPKYITEEQRSQLARWDDRGITQYCHNTILTSNVRTCLGALNVKHRLGLDGLYEDCDQLKEAVAEDKSFDWQTWYASRLDAYDPPEYDHDEFLEPTEKLTLVFLPTD